LSRPYSTSPTNPATPNSRSGNRIAEGIEAGLISIRAEKYRDSDAADALDVF